MENNKNIKISELERKTLVIMLENKLEKVLLKIEETNDLIKCFKALGFEEESKEKDSELKGLKAEYNFIKELYAKIKGA